MTAATKAPQPLSKLRVCGNNRVPFTGAECRRDQSGTALKANEFDCSVRVNVRRKQRLVAQIRYLGSLQFQYSARVTPLVRSRVIGTYFFHTKMPAGGYSCRFSLGGQHLGVSFRSAGPAANILGPAVCLAAHRVGKDECKQDEGGAPIPATNGITCDAVFAREKGRTATIELLDATGAIVASKQNLLRYPITESGATFTSSNARFRSGAYECGFSVAGAHAVRPFHVSG